MAQGFPVMQGMPAMGGVALGQPQYQLPQASPHPRLLASLRCPDRSKLNASCVVQGLAGAYAPPADFAPGPMQQAAAAPPGAFGAAQQQLAQAGPAVAQSAAPAPGRGRRYSAMASSAAPQQ